MFGVLVVETISKIRRAFFHQKKSIRTISRELKVSRKVIRKVIRSGATELRYERSVQPMPKIGPWREQLDGLLLSNEGKPRRERLTHIPRSGPWSISPPRRSAQWRPKWWQSGLRVGHARSRGFCGSRHGLSFACRAAPAKVRSRSSCGGHRDAST
jgi:hypothetical protein